MDSNNGSNNLPSTAVAAIDYLTVTTKTEARSASLLHALLASQKPEFWYENKAHPWKFKGFHGKAYEGIRYGLRADEAIVMISGSKASELWLEIAPRGDKCTRIDLAVTVTYKNVVPGLARHAYEQWRQARSGTGSLIENANGGSTAYIGSRQSRAMARMYDKGAEQGGEPGLSWRFELEFKKPMSGEIILRLLQAEDPAEFIFSYLAMWAEARGISPIWYAANRESAIEIRGYVSSPDRQLEWLRTQVKPTIGRLIIADRLKDVIEALGLSKAIEQLDTKEVSKWQ